MSEIEITESLKKLAKTNEIDPIIVDYVKGLLNESTYEEGLAEIDSVYELLSAYLPESQLEIITVESWLRTLYDNKISSEKESQLKRTEANCKNVDVSLKWESSLPLPSKTANNKRNVEMDKSIKDKILSKHGVCVVNEGCAPPPPVKVISKDTKTRYLDGKVVSNKGDRFITLKDPREDSDEMKKTYVNLKPAKKYRFH